MRNYKCFWSRDYAGAEIGEWALVLVFCWSSLFSSGFAISHTAAIHEKRVASAASFTETNEASVGECPKGVSAKFSRNIPEDAGNAENAEDSQPAGMPSTRGH